IEQCRLIRARKLRVLIDAVIDEHAFVQRPRHFRRSRYEYPSDRIPEAKTTACSQQTPAQRLSVDPPRDRITVEWNYQRCEDVYRVGDFPVTCAERTDLLHNPLQVIYGRGWIPHSHRVDPQHTIPLREP